MKKVCIYCPSCSNFAVGLLRRYPWAQAIKGAHRRYVTCNGTAPTYSFAFQPAAGSLELAKIELQQQIEPHLEQLDIEHIRSFFEGSASDLGLTYPSSTRWLTDPAQNFCGRVQVYTGLTLLDGTFLSRDYEGAFKMFERARVMGEADADFFLALLYHYGFGIPRNYAKAYFFFNRAVARGDSRAVDYRERLEDILPTPTVISAQTGKIPE